jgi:sterol desaturase/sphingolipid hydroxylase (fatty acid hydroxylase superfamily)
MKFLPTSLTSAGWFAGGVALVPFIDYAWHAWIGHAKRPLPTRDQHREHHRAPYLAAPTEELRKNVPLAAATALGAALALTPLLGVKRAVPFAAGVVTAYVLITYSHARMHARGPRTRYERWFWRFHFHHHFGDAKKNFGLITPIFDVVFRTIEVPPIVTIPAQLAPKWLTADQPGFRLRKSAA